MKGYVVTLMNIPASVNVANRCIESGKRFGINIEMFPATYKDKSRQELNKLGLKVGKFDPSWSNPDAVLGNFVSQYKIWNKIAESGEPGIVLEHDAVFTSKLPKLKGDIINLGKPSYGRFFSKKEDEKGCFPMFSKKGGYIPGAHCYYLTPAGAKQLIQKAKQVGAGPCDIFINNKNFPNIMEIYPWCAEVIDTFSTIQKEKGCIAKHNYNKDFKLI